MTKRTKTTKRTKKINRIKRNTSRLEVKKPMGSAKKGSQRPRRIRRRSMGAGCPQMLTYRRRRSMTP